MAFPIPTCILMALPVWCARHRLAGLDFEALAAVLVIRARPAEIVLRQIDGRRGYGLPYPRGAEVAFQLTAPGLTVAVLLAHSSALRLPRLGRAFALATPGLPGGLASDFVVRLGWAAIAEQALCAASCRARGAISVGGMGDLDRSGPAGWVGRINNLGKARLSFWLLIPAAGLAWRTRSPSTSTAAHAGMTSTGLLLATLAARL